MTHKHFSQILMLISLLALASSCTGLSSSETLEYLPVKVLPEEDWSLSDPHGHLKMELVGAMQVSPAINGFFSVTDSSGQVSVCRADAWPEPMSGLTGLRAAGVYAEGLLPLVYADGSVGAVDGFGRVKFRIRQAGSVKIAKVSARFRCGRLGVCDDSGRWGAVDSDGRPVIAPEFDNELLFCDGYAIATVAPAGANSESWRYSIVDLNGQTICRFHSGLTAGSLTMSDGKAAVCDNGRWGLMNHNGRIKYLPTEARGIDAFDDTYIIYVNSNGRRGLMDRSGEVILPARYNSLEFASKGTLLASNAQSYFLIDRRGNEIMRFDNADEVVSLLREDGVRIGGGFGFAVRSGLLWSLYDQSGTRVGRYEFSSIVYDHIFGHVPLSTSSVQIRDEGGSNPPVMEIFADSIYIVPDSLLEPTE